MITHEGRSSQGVLVAQCVFFAGLRHASFAELGWGWHRGKDATGQVMHWVPLLLFHLMGSVYGFSK